MITNPSFKSFIKRFLKYKVNGRDAMIRKDDVFLVSYPKSGNTWLRFILGNIFHDGRVDFNNFNDIVPDIYQSSKVHLDSLKNPRIIKSHENYVKKYPKVVYIIRDPRDVVISYYYWNKKYKKDFLLNLEEYILSFINGENLTFGSWKDHVFGWFEASKKHEKKILILKYEDLKSDEFGCVKEILRFIGKESNPTRINMAIENSKFDKMQKLESQQSLTSSYLKSSREDIKFVRSGKTEWPNILFGELKMKFKDKFGQSLVDLGYESDLNW